MTWHVQNWDCHNITCNEWFAASVTDHLPGISSQRCTVICFIDPINIADGEPPIFLSCSHYMALSKTDEDHRTVLPKNTIFQNFLFLSAVYSIFLTYIYICLVGGAIIILKNMKVNGKDDIPYMKWTNNPVMFQSPSTRSPSYSQLVVGLYHL